MPPVGAPTGRYGRRQPPGRRRVTNAGKRKNSVHPCSNTKQEKEMSKLFALIVAAMFTAVTGSALAAAHAGAADKKGDAKMEKKSDKKKSSKKKSADKKSADKKSADKMDKK